MAQPDGQLFTALARSAERCVGELKAQELANTAWSFATVAQPDVQLFTALARTAERCVGEFKAQHLANTAWAFATADQSDALLSGFGEGVTAACG